MKTLCTNIDQTFLDISNLVIASVKRFNFNKLVSLLDRSTDLAGHYMLPLAKQLFRETFMGSDMEMGILLIFLNSYFLSAAKAVRHNVITDFFKKLRGRKNTITVSDTKKIYEHKQAA